MPRNGIDRRAFSLDTEGWSLGRLARAVRCSLSGTAAAAREIPDARTTLVVPPQVWKLLPWNKEAPMCSCRCVYVDDTMRIVEEADGAVFVYVRIDESEL